MLVNKSISAEMAMKVNDIYQRSDCKIRRSLNDTIEVESAGYDSDLITGIKIIQMDYDEDIQWAYQRYDEAKEVHSNNLILLSIFPSIKDVKLWFDQDEKFESEISLEDIMCLLRSKSEILVNTSITHYNREWIIEKFSNAFGFITTRSCDENDDSFLISSDVPIFQDTW